MATSPFLVNWLIGAISRIVAESWEWFWEFSISSYNFLYFTVLILFIYIFIIYINTNINRNTHLITYNKCNLASYNIYTYIITTANTTNSLHSQTSFPTVCSAFQSHWLTYQHFPAKKRQNKQVDFKSKSRAHRKLLLRWYF